MLDLTEILIIEVVYRAEQKSQALPVAEFPSASEIIIETNERGEQIMPYFEPGFDEKLKRSNRLVSRVLGTMLSLGIPAAAFIAENTELLRAAQALKSYEAPAPADMIPDNSGCISTTVKAGGGLTKPGVAYIPDRDAAFKDIEGTKSAASTFPTSMAPSGYKDTELLYGLNGSYFNQTIGKYKTSFGANLRIRYHEGDEPFLFNTQAFEQFVSDLLTKTDIHPNPQIRQLLECKAKQIMEDGILEGKNLDINIIANNDKSLEGFNVVTFDPGLKTSSHSYGFGVCGTGIEWLGRKLTPDGVLIISGGDNNPENSLRAIIKRLIHETIHCIINQDLTDAIAERDEQERAVQYITENLVNYYEQNGGLPVIIYTGIYAQVPLVI